MSKKYLVIFLIPFILFSCSTGKKALQKGNYYTAISKAVERLKSDPDNEKAQQVLQEGYPLAIQWSQEELDIALTSNRAFKWERAINIMRETNHLSELIRSTPIARKIIIEPKSYTSELNMAFDKAANERYQAGLNFIDRETREDARTACLNTGSAIKN